MLNAILVFCIVLYSIYALDVLFTLCYKIRTNASLQGNDMIPDYLHELEHSYNNWENIETFEFYDFDRMDYKYTLVIKHSNGNYYKAITHCDGEQSTSDFEDLDWKEVKLKEITITDWVEV